ncbi:Mob1 family [Aspergillus sclerotialis]|uniref:Mob1 family n=1 Tax=Aspergillus sclerotialis TaxID=2070753 RepID=A0A3A2ZG10_9EURO|nr:Mob1 family [Aspergillus sclerotialis]
MAAAGVSPSSSPRLPSPPPFTEVQIGPKSPSVGESFGKDAEQLLTGFEDDGLLRRIRPGTKAADMAFGPPLVPLSQLDSPFQLQEHLKALYNHFTKPENSGTIVPINREVAIQLAEPPEGVDKSLWLYELCRFLTMKVNNLIIAFFAEDPPCSSNTCPEMRASEWQYLCAVHDPPKSCCAIDYCCHTLDWATNILTSPKFFPSRLTLGSAAHGGPQASMRHLTNIFRRLYRIFAHAWFQHRDVFWEVEGHDGLYIFFKTVCDMYNLIPEDNYTVPPEAEGQDAQQPTEQETKDGRRLTILRKDDDTPSYLMPEPTDAPGATTRRHKHSPSTGSRVTTIAESAEDVEEEQKPSLPGAHEESGQKKAEEQSVVEPVGGAESTAEQTEDTSEEKLEAQEKKAEEVTEASQSQPVESQPTEQQQPEPESSEDKPSEAGAPEPEASVPEKPPTEEEKEQEGSTEEQKGPAKPEESNGDNDNTQESSEAEKSATEEESFGKPSQPESETESKSAEEAAEAFREP